MQIGNPEASDHFNAVFHCQPAERPEQRYDQLPGDGEFQRFWCHSGSNPARDHFQIQGLADIGHAYIVIRSLSGQVIKSYVISEEDQSGEILTHGLPVGLYTVSISQNGDLQIMQLQILR